MHRTPLVNRGNGLETVDEIRHRGRVAVTLRGRAAAGFLAEAETGFAAAQQAMARPYITDAVSLRVQRGHAGVPATVTAPLSV